MLNETEFALGNTRAPGVEPGDFAKYSMIVTWNSTDPNATAPTDPSYLLFAQTDSFFVSVKNVSSSTVWLEIKTRFKNTTEQTGSGLIDVDEGFMTGEAKGWWFISANLTAGDPLFNRFSFLINETIQSACLGAVRALNHLNVTQLLDQNSTAYYDSFWDKTTGCLIQQSYAVHNSTGMHATEWYGEIVIVESNFIPTRASGLSNFADPIEDWFNSTGHPVEGSNYTDIIAASITQKGTMLQLNMTLAGDIPEEYAPISNEIDYNFLFDTDKNESSGMHSELATNDLGVDYFVGIAYSPSSALWITRLFNVTDGSYTNLTDVQHSANTLSVNIFLSSIGQPASFDWMVFTRGTNQTYSSLEIMDKAPNVDHASAVIPELPPFMILPLFIIMTLLALVVRKRAHACS